MKMLHTNICTCKGIFLAESTCIGKFVEGFIIYLTEKNSIGLCRTLLIWCAVFICSKLELLVHTFSIK